MKILFVGDVVGKPGRQILRRALPALVARRGIDLVVANVENAAGGKGVTREVAEAIRDAGVGVMTTGNHVWDKKEAIDYIGLEPRLLRPANFPAGVPGAGCYVARSARHEPVAVINVMGRIFMNPLDNPFHVVRAELEAVRSEARVVVVDFHRGGHVREAGDGLAPRRRRHRRARHPYPRADRRRARAAERHGVHHRRGHDRAARLESSACTRGPPCSASSTACRPGSRRPPGTPALNAVLVTADAATGAARGIERLSLSAADVEAQAAGAGAA